MSDRERIALFIDGVHLYNISKLLGFEIDYERLLAYFQKRGQLIRAYYYAGMIDDQGHCLNRPFLDWLDYNGYTVVTKPLKSCVDSLGQRKVMGNMAIEMAVDTIEMAGYFDHIFLFCGNGDFRSVVVATQRKGARVTVVSTITTQQAMIASELRRQADAFVDIINLVGAIGRDPSERAERMQRQQEQRQEPLEDEEGNDGE